MVNNNLKILLIEDNPGDARLIKELLNQVTSFNFDLWNAETLSDGLKFIEEREFDVILLDLKLPDSDGFETVLRTREKVKKIPIIVITGLNDEILARKAVQTGAQDYLIKGEIEGNPLIRAILHSIDRYKIILAMDSLTKSLQETEARFRKIIEENADSIIIIDKSGKVKFLNPAAERYLNKKINEIIGLFFYLPKRDGEKNEISIAQKDGVILTGEIQAVKIEWDNEPAYLLTLRDISERKKFEEKLKESEKKYRDLFENSPYPILIVNMDGIFLDCNSMLEKLIGYGKDEILYKCYTNTPLISKKNIALFKNAFKILQEGEIPEPVQLKIKKKNKNSIWSILRFSLMDFDNKKLIYILIQDITEIKQSEQEVRRLEQTLHEMNALIEDAPLAILLIDISGKILRVNQESINLFKYREDELLNFKIHDIFDSEYTEIIDKHYNEDLYNSSELNNLEISIQRKDGKLIDVEVTSTIIKIADNMIIQSFFSDITERKNYERNREKLLDQLINSLEFKVKFMATMSHELRTPLNVISGFTDLLLEGAYGELNKEQLETLKDINSEANHLKKLTESTLDLSLIEVGKFELNFETFQLISMMKELISIVNYLFIEKGVSYHSEGISDDIYIRADPLRFKQILFNLLNNAIKFTEKGKIIFRCIDKNNHWEFQIEDTGVGIAQEDYHVIFKEFGRIEHKMKKKIPGTGLGLALTKRLVQLHGGEIWFTSQVNKGSTFFFTIPKNSETN